MKIYTKTGDDGSTSLFDGTRVQKNHLRVAAYGDIDELNSVLGVALTFIADTKTKQLLLTIQKDLFALGAQLANPTHKKQKSKADFSAEQVSYLETHIDQCEAMIPPIKTFILPGGSKAGASLDWARTVCRRAERQMLTLHHTEPIDEILIHYINRLSDLLFMLARVVNLQENTPDIPWA